MRTLLRVKLKTLLGKNHHISSTVFYFNTGVCRGGQEWSPIYQAEFLMRSRIMTELDVLIGLWLLVGGPVLPLRNSDNLLGQLPPKAEAKRDVSLASWRVDEHSKRSRLLSQHFFPVLLGGMFDVESVSQPILACFEGTTFQGGFWSIALLLYYIRMVVLKRTVRCADRPSVGFITLEHFSRRLLIHVDGVMDVCMYRVRLSRWSLSSSPTHPAERTTRHACALWRKISGSWRSSRRRCRRRRRRSGRYVPPHQSPIA